LGSSRPSISFITETTERISMKFDTEDMLLSNLILIRIG
jgi:hypothetical protein